MNNSKHCNCVAVKLSCLKFLFLIKKELLINTEVTVCNLQYRIILFLNGTLTYLTWHL